MTSRKITFYFNLAFSIKRNDRSSKKSKRRWTWKEPKEFWDEKIAQKFSLKKLNLKLRKRKTRNWRERKSWPLPACPIRSGLTWSTTTTRSRSMASTLTWTPCCTACWRPPITKSCTKSVLELSFLSPIELYQLKIWISNHFQSKCFLSQATKLWTSITRLLIIFSVLTQ